jgi:hypothetical protein
VWLRSDCWADALWECQSFGHALPLFRPLSYLFPCCLQARLRTFPIPLVLVMRGVWLSWIKVGGQKRRVQIALHRTDATLALMKAQ